MEAKSNSLYYLAVWIWMCCLNLLDTHQLKQQQQILWLEVFSIKKIQHACILLAMSSEHKVKQ